MPWSAPVSPVSGTVITVAYATANIVNPLNWIRQLTGGADPPGSSYVVISSSTSATAWGKITPDVILDNSITPAKLTANYLPLATGGTVLAQVIIANGGIDVSGGTIARTGGVQILSGGLAVNSGAMTINDTTLVTNLNADMLHGQTLAALDTRYALAGGGGGIIGLSVTGGLTVAGGINLTSGGLLMPAAGAGTVITNLNAEMVGGQTLGGLDTRFINATGSDSKAGTLTITTGGMLISGGGLNITNGGMAISGTFATNEVTNLNAQMVGGVTLAGLQNTFVNAAGDTMTGGLVISAGGAAISGGVNVVSGGLAVNGTMSINNSTQVSNLNATFLTGLSASSTPGPSRIAVSDVGGTLNSWVTSTSGATVAGMVVGWDSTGAVPPGWAPWAEAAGRLLLGTGSSFEAGTIAINTNYGSTWLHTHTNVNHSHAATGLTITGGISNSTVANGVAPGAGNAAAHPHSHGNTFGVGGSTAGGNIAIDSTGWLPPMRGITWIKRA
jgi:hypothetical protein